MKFDIDLLDEVEGRLGIRGKILEPIWYKGNQVMRIQFDDKI